MWACSHPCCSLHIFCHTWLAPFRAEISASYQEWHCWPTLIDWLLSLIQAKSLASPLTFLPQLLPLEASWETTKSDTRVHTNITHQDYCHQCDKIYITKSDIKVHPDITHQDYCFLITSVYRDCTGTTLYFSLFQFAMKILRFIIRERILSKIALSSERGLIKSTINVGW